MAASHIAIVLHDFSTGGSERIAIRLANRWAETGRRVTLLCGTEQGLARHLVGPGVAVEVCVPETVRSPWSRLLLGWRLAKLVRKLQPDIVFSPGNFHLIILAVLARLSFKTRPVFISKLSNPIRRAGFRARIETFADAIIRRVAAPVDALVAMSPSLGREAKAVFGERMIVEIDEPVLEDGTISVARRSPSRDHPLIICAGRFCGQKDFLTAIRAFAELPPAGNARLLMLGDGPMRDRLVREAERFGVSDRIEMPGYVKDVTPYFAKAHLLLMTSRYEGYPAVLIEAIAAGLPIVTTDCSLAIREIISSDAFGTVVTSRDPGDIASAITAQLQRPRPSDSAVNKHVLPFRIGASAKAYLDLFDRLS